MHPGWKHIGRRQVEVGRLQDFKQKANANLRDMNELVDQQKAELQSAHLLLSGGDKEEQMAKFSVSHRCIAMLHVVYRAGQRDIEENVITKHCEMHTEYSQN
eukprot:scaffold152572_cov20-Prasinocladus_malaysianus.AAC.1